MLQFNTKINNSYKLPDGSTYHEKYQMGDDDPKLAKLIQSIEKNLSNLGILSGKAFKLLQKMAD